jgi:hypothetical protein
MTLEELKAKQEAEKNGAPENENDTPAEEGEEWMKCYGRRVNSENKHVFGGGGHVLFQDKDGAPIKMVPGQVRRVPKQVVEFFNNRGPRTTPVFVKPGSQKEGDPYEGLAIIH